MLILNLTEIALKSRGVRAQYEKRLSSTISLALKDLDFKLKNQGARFFLFFKSKKQEQQALDLLKKISGIHSILIAQQFNNLDEKIFSHFYTFLKNSNKTFAVRVKNRSSLKSSSQELERQIGSWVVKNTKAKVNLSNPDYTLKVNLSDSFNFFSFQTIKTMSGLPLGSAGQIFHFFIDSNDVCAPISLIKRGFNLTLVFSQINEQKLSKAIKIIESYHLGKKLRLKQVPYLDLSSINKLQKTCNQRFSRHLLFSTDIFNIEKANFNLLFPNISFSKQQLIECNKQYGNNLIFLQQQKNEQPVDLFNLIFNPKVTK